MKILNKYIAKEVLKGAFVTIVILLSLLNFFTFTDELGDLEGDYGLKQVFAYLALTSPRNFYELMPSAALIGSLVTLGAMANRQELIAMRTAGFSLFRIIWAVLRAGLVIIAVSLMVGEFVAPVSERSAQMLKTTAQKKQVALRTKYGVWLRDGNAFVNIRQIQRNNEVGSINIYKLDAHHRLVLATHAQKAVYSKGEWLFEEVEQSAIAADKVSAEKKGRTRWKSMLEPDLLNAVVVKPANLSIYELAKYIVFLRENGQKSQQFELAFWNRLVKPCVTLVMLLLAVPFVLNVRRAINAGQRIVIGVLIGLGFILSDRMFGHIGLVYGLNPLFTAVFPASLFFLASLAAIGKLR